MSDDLISRKALISDMRSRKYIDKALCEIFETVVDEAPAAFDKEKVIEELHRHSHNYYPSIDHYCLSKKAVDLKTAIEIVEKGGVE